MDITPAKHEILNTPEITPGIYDAFISYIDRPEKTTRTYLNNLRQFAAWMQREGITRPTRQDIISYRRYLEEEHPAISLDPVKGWTYREDATGARYTVTCKPATVAQYLRSVCQFFKWTAAAGIYPNIAENVHAPKISGDRHKKDALEPSDVLAIENTIKRQIDTAETSLQEEQAKRLYAIYLLAVTAGLRTIEISRANVKDLEARSGNAWLYIWGKGHTEPDTRKPLAHEVYQAIKAYLDARSYAPTANSPLFVATGNRSGGKRLASTTISTMLKRAMQAAGYDSERLTAHSLRHTAGTNVQALTRDIYATQKYMRHSNPSTTEIYLHLDTEQQEAGIAQDLYDLYHR